MSGINKEKSNSMGNVPALQVAWGLQQAVNNYNFANFTGGKKTDCGCGGHDNDPCKCAGKRRLFARRRYPKASPEVQPKANAFRGFLRSSKARKSSFRNCCGG